MKNDQQMTDQPSPDSGGEDPRTAFGDAVTALTDSLDFHDNRPVRWNAGRDMNIARPGASVVIDPAVKGGVPIIMDTDITTPRRRRTRRRTSPRRKQKRAAARRHRPSTAGGFPLRDGPNPPQAVGAHANGPVALRGTGRSRECGQTRRPAPRTAPPPMKHLTKRTRTRRGTPFSAVPRKLRSAQTPHPCTHRPPERKHRRTRRRHKTPRPVNYFNSTVF